jgi:hypothetical protein
VINHQQWYCRIKPSIIPRLLPNINLNNKSPIENESTTTEFLLSDESEVDEKLLLSEENEVHQNLSSAPRKGMLNMSIFCQLIMYETSQPLTNFSVSICVHVSVIWPNKAHLEDGYKNVVNNHNIQSLPLFACTLLLHICRCVYDNILFLFILFLLKV